MTAAEVKAALRNRHPAIAGPGWDVGPWTCLEEYENIDLLALAAWTQPRPARCRGARIGYEVKVSRSDYKRELRKPSKRARAVALCHEFYLAVPAGLLTADELTWTPPEGLDRVDAFARLPCQGYYGLTCYRGILHLGPRAHYVRSRGFFGVRIRPDDGRRRVPEPRRYDATCPTCAGKGWTAESPAVRAGAPKLWIPADVGLLQIDGRGVARLAKEAPLRRDAGPLTDVQVGLLARWASVRPDPRHRRGGDPLEQALTPL